MAEIVRSNNNDDFLLKPNIDLSEKHTKSKTEQARQNWNQLAYDIIITL